MDIKKKMENFSVTQDKMYLAKGLHLGTAWLLTYAAFYPAVISEVLAQLKWMLEKYLCQNHLGFAAMIPLQQMPSNFLKEYVLHFDTVWLGCDEV